MILSRTEETVWHLPWFALSASQSCMIQWCCLFLANVQMMFSPSTLRSYWCSKQLTGLSLQVPESFFLKLTEWHYWENFFLIWIWILFSFCARIPLNKRIKICVVIQKLFPQVPSVFWRPSCPCTACCIINAFPVEGLCFVVVKERIPSSPLHLCNEKQIGTDFSTPSWTWSTGKEWNLAMKTEIIFPPSFSRRCLYRDGGT